MHSTYETSAIRDRHGMPVMYGRVSVYLESSHYLHLHLHLHGPSASVPHLPDSLVHTSCSPQATHAHVQLSSTCCLRAGFHEIAEPGDLMLLRWYPPHLCFRCQVRMCMVDMHDVHAAVGPSTPCRTCCVIESWVRMFTSSRVTI